ncbi:Formamidopyrimidine-DNA glycosylase [bacterium HR09]|uniref:Formamidopyrimidine-DNA glycosylase n=1 Tax=uncultured prokaryote TaxID=198431 RepID=H5SKU1_9ZZZZ|nr:formamidopyrimidine-DNA glycosylase [uncultured prokaryote]GBC80125.1 Formamidopyrimidine-DNA glycosylase [bacterium HR09]
MPELPEVETVRQVLAQHLCGQEVRAVTVLNGNLRVPVDAHALSELAGLCVQQVGRRGKYLWLGFPGRTLVCHLGMSGRFFLAFSRGTPPPHTHVLFAFASGLRLFYVDPRRFGLLQVVAESHSLFSQLGPEPTDTDAVAKQLESARKRKKVSVRNVLLDQKLIAGIGNIYANEALFAAGIRPQTPVSRLSKKQIFALAAAIGEVTARAVAAGGTTLRDGSFTNALGHPGYFAVELAVYGREGQACRRCGTAIRRILLTGRSAFFCPTCQR